MAIIGGMETKNAPLHLVLGAGQIGTRVASLLLDRGHRVRLVKRGPAGAARPRLEWVAGDITDHGFAGSVAQGAAVVYDCLNPLYHQWHDTLFPLAGGALQAARRAGARLVALDCLYMYGRPSGPLREDSPLVPCSVEGELRVRLAELRLSAHRAGDVRVSIGRASDFFGADLPYSAFSDRFYQRVLAGKPAECMGDPPAALVQLRRRRRAHARPPRRARARRSPPCGLPTNAAESTRALVERLGRALDREIAVARVPKLMLRAAGVLSPFLREVVKMTYQWEVPFVHDDSRFRAAFGMPVDESVAATAAWRARATSSANPPDGLARAARSHTEVWPPRPGSVGLRAATERRRRSAHFALAHCWLRPATTEIVGVR